jgi:hypothetical protein
LSELPSSGGNSIGANPSIARSLEFRLDVEAEMADMHRTITALKSEIDLMREVLPPSNVKTKDALKLVRSLGESG